MEFEKKKRASPRPPPKEGEKRKEKEAGKIKVETASRKLKLSNLLPLRGSRRGPIIKQMLNMEINQYSKQFSVAVIGCCGETFEASKTAKVWAGGLPLAARDALRLPAPHFRNLNNFAFYKTLKMRAHSSWLVAHSFVSPQNQIAYETYLTKIKKEQFAWPAQNLSSNLPLGGDTEGSPSFPLFLNVREQEEGALLTPQTIPHLRQTILRLSVEEGVVTSPALTTNVLRYPYTGCYTKCRKANFVFTMVNADRQKKEVPGLRDGIFEAHRYQQTQTTRIDKNKQRIDGQLILKCQSRLLFLLSPLRGIPEGKGVINKTKLASLDCAVSPPLRGKLAGQGGFIN